MLDASCYKCRATSEYIMNLTLNLLVDTRVTKRKYKCGTTPGHCALLCDRFDCVLLLGLTTERHLHIDLSSRVLRLLRHNAY